MGIAEVDTAVATETNPYPFDAQDSPGEVSNMSYVVTAQQVGASGNGTVIYAAGTVTIGP